MRSYKLFAFIVVLLFSVGINTSFAKKINIKVKYVAKFKTTPWKGKVTIIPSVNITQPNNVTNRLDSSGAPLLPGKAVTKRFALPADTIKYAPMLTLKDNKGASVFFYCEKGILPSVTSVRVEINSFITTGSYGALNCTIRVE